MRVNACALKATLAYHPNNVPSHYSLFIGWRSAIPGFTLPYIAADKPVATHAEFFRREIDPTYKRVQVQTYICKFVLTRSYITPLQVYILRIIKLDD